MARRYNTRRIKKHHNYSFEEAADALGVHVQTVRGWVAQGLRCMTEGRPFLILGADLIAFHDQRADGGKTRLGPNELFCLKCRTARTPAGRAADFIPYGPDRGRLSGICPECESICHRFARRDRLSVVAPDLSIEIPVAFERLKEPGEAA